jgi:hypothetical protein
MGMGRGAKDNLGDASRLRGGRAHDNARDKRETTAGDIEPGALDGLDSLPGNDTGRKLRLEIDEGVPLTGGELKREIARQAHGLIEVRLFQAQALLRVPDLDRIYLKTRGARAVKPTGILPNGGVAARANGLRDRGNSLGAGDEPAGRKKGLVQVTGIDNLQRSHISSALSAFSIYDSARFESAARRGYSEGREKP